MLVLTDSRRYASEVLPRAVGSRLAAVDAPSPPERRLGAAFLGRERSLYRAAWPKKPWRRLLLTPWSSGSQYDRMIELVRSGGLPDRLLSVAGAGEGFHGSGGRGWSAEPGNLHVVAHVAPRRRVERYETAFTVLAVVSVVEAVDAVPGLDGRASIKWVNDVLVDGAKVAGVLAYTSGGEGVVSSAVLGIGLNVSTAPEVQPTPFTPAVAAVRDLAPDPAGATREKLLDRLIDALARNYVVLLERGYGPLLARYRDRSCVPGARVAVCREAPASPPDVVAEGRVAGIGDGLELHLEGRARPVERGRLILKRPGGVSLAGASPGIRDGRPERSDPAETAGSRPRAPRGRG